MVFCRPIKTSEPSYQQMNLLTVGLQHISFKNNGMIAKPLGLRMYGTVLYEYIVNFLAKLC